MQNKGEFPKEYNMNGNITDIQRFSLHDGPGIRTTVFFKGCNMRCSWCHNPETIGFKNDLLYYDKNCIHCGYCLDTCKNGVHSVSTNGAHQIDKNKCLLCGECVKGCFSEALKFAARSVSADEVMQEIIADRAYYEESGGGVTLSGGEALCQAEFAESIIDRCRKERISVAVETNLLHDFDKIKHILKKLDLVMFDIKIFDDEEHKKHTGVSNKLVFENAKKLDELGVPFIVRTPLIPGVTDSNENILAIAEFTSILKNLSVYELLNFNPLGGSKYTAIDKNNHFADAKPLSKERLSELAELTKNYNVKIR